MGSTRRPGPLSRSVQRHLRALARIRSTSSQYTNFDIYHDTNAYYSRARGAGRPAIGERDYLGGMLSTVEQQNLRELVEGTHSRSGGQWDIWEAVFSPIGADGYPRRIYDKRTGVIDP